MRAIWFVVIATACGGGGGGNPDAMRAPDAGPDASARGTVRVHVLDRTGAPIAGIPVVFLDPDDSLVGRISTDGTGTAAADVLPGGSVTSVYSPANQSFILQTVAAVEPGDDITLARREPSGAVTGTFTVNWALNPTADGYIVNTPCGQVGTGVTTSYTFMLTQECQRTSLDLSVVARNSASGGYVGYVEQRAVPFVDGGSTNMPTTWAPLPTATLAYSNIGAEVTSIGWDRSVPDLFGFVTSASVNPSGTTATLNVQTTTGPTALDRSSVSRDGAFQEILQGSSGDALSHGLDLEGTLLPWLAPPSFDPATGAITVPPTNGGAGPAADVFWIQLEYGLAQFDVQWSIVAPTAAGLTLPRMPPEVGDIGPHAGDILSQLVTQLYESSAVTDYAAVRADPFAVLDSLPAAAVGTTTRRSMAIALIE
jgi:hypothetical protein